MSHFDGESSAVAVEAGLAESCAARARGRIATKAKAVAQLKDFRTRECMRFFLRKSSEQSADKRCVELTKWLGLTRVRTIKRLDGRPYSTINRTIGKFSHNTFFNMKQYPIVQCF